MSKFKGKKVLVVGFGTSGVSVAKYMTEEGAKVIVTDLKQKSELSDYVNACADLKIEYELTKHNDLTFKSVDLVVLSPGVPPNIKPLDFTREANIQITNEIELGATSLNEPLICVTGTNGKTTTTTLIGEMFTADQKSAYVGGNIGKPLLDYVREDKKGDVVIAETSSFQLELIQKLVPAVAVFTNLEEDHLDRYPNIDTYFEAKKNLLRVCDKNSYVVLNYDNPTLASWASSTPGRVIWFTMQNPIKVGGAFAENFTGCYYDSEKKQIVSKINGKEELYDVSQLKIFGDHNKENVMAAVCAARVMGVSPKAIQSTILNFKGVSHRLEFVKKKDGVFFFNDSKATNAMSIKRSLCAFQTNPIILIAGGKDKNTEFAPLAELVRKRVKILILLGEAKEKMNRSIGDFTETYLVGTFDEAVLLAFQKSRRGDIVLLSPGCASFDMFRNFEERGDYFKKLVNEL